MNTTATATSPVVIAPNTHNLTDLASKKPQRNTTTPATTLSGPGPHVIPPNVNEIPHTVGTLSGGKRRTKSRSMRKRRSLIKRSKSLKQKSKGR